MKKIEETNIEETPRKTIGIGFEEDNMEYRLMFMGESIMNGVYKTIKDKCAELYEDKAERKENKEYFTQVFLDSLKIEKKDKKCKKHKKYKKLKKNMKVKKLVTWDDDGRVIVDSALESEDEDLNSYDDVVFLKEIKRL